MKAVAQLLRERIGLDPASVGPTVIERAVRLRMKAHQINQPATYLSLLRDSAAEWRELVESVVVTETWFFRDQEPFAAFGRLVRDEWLPLNPSRPLRVLSVPCSSGEEPYSLVMTLLEAGLPPRRFQVDAADLSERALARARAAVYSRNSFRGRTLDFRDRYFRETKAGYELRRDVCDCVRFHCANVLEADFFAGVAPYDFVFCRNLLIYFDRPTQERVLRRLHSLLAPRGLLFVGPAELPLVAGHGFAPANLPLAFACRKADRENAPAPAARKPLPPSRPAPPPVRSPSAGPAPKPTPPRPASPPRRPAFDLTAARALADAGQLREAAAACQAHLAHHGPSAQAYYLLGLITEADADAARAATADGETRAARRAPVSALDYYRKALYLEPDHYESLLQMALLLEKQGERAAAAAFRRRLNRLETSPRRSRDGRAASDGPSDAPAAQPEHRGGEGPAERGTEP